MPNVTTKQRCIAAAIVGLFLHIIIFKPWLPYGHRESGPPNLLALFVVLAIAGLILTFGVEESRAKIVACIVAGMFLGNAALILYDWTDDLTNHNLFPFEFIMIAFALVPVSVGALVSKLAGRLRG